MAYPQGAALRQRDRHRYGAQIQLGNGGRLSPDRLSPDLQAFSIDYARYNYYNIGFRTGLNVFLDSDVFDYYSIPMQFTWRTGRMVSAWRRSRTKAIRTTTLMATIITGRANPTGAVRSSPRCSRFSLGVRSAYGFHTGHDVRPLSLPPYDGDFSSDTASAVLSMSARG
ncbi:MAG: hypothetical protein ACLRMJ_07235 [Alistipes finegoldii]